MPNNPMMDMMDNMNEEIMNEMQPVFEAFIMEGTPVMMETVADLMNTGIEWTSDHELVMAEAKGAHNWDEHTADMVKTMAMKMLKAMA